MLIVGWPRQHDHLGRVMRCEHVTLLGRGHTRHGLEQVAKPTHFDAQPGAVRLVRLLAAKGTRDQRVARHVGRPFPWVSSLGGDFNYDFKVSLTEQRQLDGTVEYNYRREPAWTLRGIGDAMTKEGEGPVAQIAATTGTDVATYTRERPGMSAFVREDGAIHHTYSTYSRGLDGLWGSYQWLDRAPKGRNETGIWWRRHDEYEAPARTTSAACCA